MPVLLILREMTVPKLHQNHNTDTKNERHGWKLSFCETTVKNSDEIQFLRTANLSPFLTIVPTNGSAKMRPKAFPSLSPPPDGCNHLFLGYNQ